MSEATAGVDLTKGVVVVGERTGTLYWKASLVTTGSVLYGLEFAVVRATFIEDGAEVRVDGRVYARVNRKREVRILVGIQQLLEEREAGQ